MHNQIAPHGGELVNRTLTGDKRDFWIEKAKELVAKSKATAPKYPINKGTGKAKK